jgi:hypothetical protein
VLCGPRVEVRSITELVYGDDSCSFANNGICTPLASNPRTSHPIRHAPVLIRAPRRCCVQARTAASPPQTATRPSSF